MLNLETLDTRALPATVTLTGTSVLVVGDLNLVNEVTVGAGDTATSIKVTVNGKSQQFDGITQVVAVGGNKADVLTNNTAVAFVAVGGKGDDTLFGGTGVNTLVAGAGKDVVYSLLGTNTVVTADDAEADRVYVGNGAAVAADGKDQVVTFFAKGRVPNSGIVQLDAGVLYITPPVNGSSTVINEVGNKLVVSYDFGTGPVVATFAKKDVKVIAYFGGSGNDTFVNNSTVEEAAYGGAGNDTVIGGFGPFSLLKGSGGNDFLQARAKKADVSGNGGADVILLGPGANVVRYDALDVLVGAKPKDVLVLS